MESAVLADCQALAATSKQAFDHDVNYGAPGPGGPPGYDSLPWHRKAMGWGSVFRLVHDARIVGGAIVIARPGGHLELGRIWLVPAMQCRGLGVVAMSGVENRFADVQRWTLETPCWNLRNQRFYLKVGYREVSRTASRVVYEKRCGSGVEQKG